MRLYEHSVLSFLSLERRVVNPAVAWRQAYTTGGPRTGVTTCYYWDMAYQATLLVLLDPDYARSFVRRALAGGLNASYEIDYFSGRPEGRWYAFNGMSLLTLALTYVRITGDAALLWAPAVATDGAGDEGGGHVSLVLAAGDCVEEDALASLVFDAAHPKRTELRPHAPVVLLRLPSVSRHLLPSATAQRASRTLAVKILRSMEAFHALSYEEVEGLVRASAVGHVAAEHDDFGSIDPTLIHSQDLVDCASQKIVGDEPAVPSIVYP